MLHDYAAKNDARFIPAKTNLTAVPGDDRFPTLFFIR